MTALTPDDLARIEELAEKATPGPWFRDYGDVVIDDSDPRDQWADEPRDARVFRAASHRPMRDPQAIADAAFAVEARSAIPALVSAVRSLEAQLATTEAGSLIECARCGTTMIRQEESNTRTNLAMEVCSNCCFEIFSEETKAAEARVAEAEAVIAEAPHGFFCNSEGGEEPDECDCWKSTAPSAVLARVKAEAKAEALLEEAGRIRGYTLDFTSAHSMFDHILRLIERNAGHYRAGADQ